MLELRSRAYEALCALGAELNDYCMEQAPATELVDVKLSAYEKFFWDNFALSLLPFYFSPTDACKVGPFVFE